jgi:hypothetical protein
LAVGGCNLREANYWYALGVRRSALDPLGHKIFFLRFVVFVKDFINRAAK